MSGFFREINGSELVDLTPDTAAPSNTAPTIAAIANQNVQAGQVVSITAIGSDGENDTLTYTFRQISGTSITLSGTGNMRTFTAPSDANTHTIVIGVIANDGALDSAEVSATVNVAAFVEPNVPGQSFNVASSAFGEMDVFYQNIDNVFATGVTDENGDYIDLSIYTGAEYCIFDRLGNKDVELTLNNGITKSGTDFIISLADTVMDFSGLRQHQLVGIRSDGQRDLIFKRRLTVMETC